MYLCYSHLEVFLGDVDPPLSQGVHSGFCTNALRERIKQCMMDGHQVRSKTTFCHSLNFLFIFCKAITRAIAMLILKVFFFFKLIMCKSVASCQRQDLVKCRI